MSIRYTPDVSMLLWLVAYLIGSIPIGVIVGRMRGVDPRSVGSGNIGATNMMRSLGPGIGLLVLLLDIAKGLLPVMIARHVPTVTDTYQGHVWAEGVIVLTGMAAIVGHNWPVFLGFKGGKGVATTGGVLFGLDWRVGVLALIVFLVFLLLTRYVSVASTAAGLSIPMGMWWFQRTNPAPGAYMGFGVLAALFVLYKHRANYQRLARGTEPKFVGKQQNNGSKATTIE